MSKLAQTSLPDVTSGKYGESLSVSRTGRLVAPSSFASKEDWIWLAGFFEGEGSVDKDPRSPSLVLAQVNPEPMVKVQAICGGNTYLRPAKGNGKPCLIWKVYGSRARRVVENIYPYLSTKRKRELAIFLEGVMN